MVAKLSNSSFTLSVTGGGTTAPTAPDRAALYSISDLWTAEAPSNTFCAGEVGFLLEPQRPTAGSGGSSPVAYLTETEAMRDKRGGKGLHFSTGETRVVQRLESPNKAK